MATGKNTKGTRTKKTTEGESRERHRESKTTATRDASKRPEGQSGTAEDLFWGGSDDKGEVQ